MTLQEAIKSGKPFRRRCQPVGWIVIRLNAFILICGKNLLTQIRDYIMTDLDILAEDWETNET